MENILEDIFDENGALLVHAIEVVATDDSVLQADLLGQLSELNQRGEAVALAVSSEQDNNQINIFKRRFAGAFILQGHLKNDEDLVTRARVAAGQALINLGDVAVGKVTTATFQVIRNVLESENITDYDELELQKELAKQIEQLILMLKLSDMSANFADPDKPTLAELIEMMPIFERLEVLNDDGTNAERSHNSMAKIKDMVVGVQNLLEQTDVNQGRD
jgi:hypothetical protein